MLCAYNGIACSCSFDYNVLPGGAASCRVLTQKYSRHYNCPDFSARLQLMLAMGALYSHHADSSCQLDAHRECNEVANLGPCFAAIRCLTRLLTCTATPHACYSSSHLGLCAVGFSVDAAPHIHR